MTKAIKEELKKMEQEDVEQTEEQSEETEDSAGEVSEDENEDVEQKDEETEVGEKEAEEDDSEILERERKQAEYRKRIEEKRAQQRFEPQQEQQPEEDDKAFIERLKRQEAERQRLNQYYQALEAGKRELEGYEKEYKAVFPEYEEEVGRAHEAAVSRLTLQGLSEEQAKAKVEQQKVLLADEAVRMGKDPVEAIFEEAKTINKWIDTLAQQRGYTKTAPKTNLRAVREATKPNAMTGGSGAKATKTEFKDADLQDLDGLTFGEMRKMSKRGEL